MLVSSPKYRRPLSANQIRLLRIIYKFRFVSVSLLAKREGKDKSSVYENLYVLAKQGLIAKRYDKTYKLRLRPAAYHLSSGGIKYLRTNSETAKLVSESVLRNYYKNKTISEDHIDHCLNVIAVYYAIDNQTNKGFAIYSQSEQTPIEALPRPLPDLYLRRIKLEEDKQRDYMLDVFEPSLPFWVIKKRLRLYQNHAEESELDKYPYLLLVAPNDRIEQRIQGIMENMYDDFEVYTTTTGRILDPENATNPKVWRQVFEEEYVEL